MRDLEIPPYPRQLFQLYGMMLYLSHGQITKHLRIARKTKGRRRGDRSGAEEAAHNSTLSIATIDIAINIIIARVIVAVGIVIRPCFRIRMNSRTSRRNAWVCVSILPYLGAIYIPLYRSFPKCSESDRQGKIARDRTELHK